MKDLQRWPASFNKERIISTLVCLGLLAVAVPQVSRAAVSALTAALSTRELCPGDVAVVTLSPSDGVTAVCYHLDNQTIELQRDEKKRSYFAFIPVDLGEMPGEKKVTITATDSRGSTTELPLSFMVHAKDFPVQNLSLPESMVTLSKKDLARYNREKARVQEVLAGGLRERLWQNGFVRPVPGDLKTPFGVRRIINNKPRSPHSGVDFKAPQGAPVAASGDGTVALVADHFFSGKSVFIDHGMGIFTMYFHLSKVLVKPGEKITTGRTVGLAGATGRATGPHLHFGVRVNNKRVDPLSFLRLFEE